MSHILTSMELRYKHVYCIFGHHAGLVINTGCAGMYAGAIIYIP